MKILLAATGTLPLLTAGVALAQGGGMMDGFGWGMGTMGGYGIWGPILLVVVVAGVVAFIMQRKGK